MPKKHVKDYFLMWWHFHIHIFIWYVHYFMFGVFEMLHFSKIIRFKSFLMKMQVPSHDKKLLQCFLWHFILPPVLLIWMIQSYNMFLYICCIYIIWSSLRIIFYEKCSRKCSNHVYAFTCHVSPPSQIFIRRICRFPF